MPYQPRVNILSIVPIFTNLFNGNHDNTSYQTTTQPEDAPTQQVPDAKLIIKFYDESGNFVESKEQAITSRAASEWENLRSNLVASQNGEIEVSIVNNDTSIPVYFDNLKIQVLGDEKPLVLQENHYYPFGMNMKGIENEPEKYHKFQYNGKEKQTELGLNLVDYGQRMHDTQLGRFHKVDRFAEKYYDLSGYNYTANNPIKNIDVNGDSIWIVINKNHRALYKNGTLYNEDGKTAYNGKGVAKKGKNAGQYKGFLKKAFEALNTLSTTSAEGEGLVFNLQDSENNFFIKKTTQGNEFIADNTQLAAANLPEFSGVLAGYAKTGSGGTIKWNPNSKMGGYDSNGKRKREPFLGLAHEMYHARDANYGRLYPKRDFVSPQAGVNYQARVGGVLKAEISAVYQENSLRNSLGISLRRFYEVNDNTRKCIGLDLINNFLRNSDFLYR